MSATPQATRARQRLNRPFQVLLLITFLVISVGAVGMTLYYAPLARETSLLSHNLGETLRLNNALRRQIGQQVDLVHRYVQRPDPSSVGRFRELDFAITRDQTRYLRLQIGAQERLTISRIKAVQAELAISSMFLFEMARDGVDDAVLARHAEIERLELELLDLFDELSALQAGDLEAAINRNRGLMTASGGYVLASAIAFAALTLAFTVQLRRRVLRPIGRLLQEARRIRRGDFDARAPAQRTDEVGQLAEEFNHMAAALADSYSALETKVEERARAIETLQRQLIQSEKMSAVGQLVSGVAHELNNPLTGIMGYAELAIRRDSADRQEDRKTFEVILTQAERCGRIVADLLQFARQSDTQLEPTSLNAEVSRALRLRHYEMSTHNIELESEYASEDPVIMADPFKIQQVVLVLVNNAIDAINEASGKGTIRVTTRCEDDDVILEVEDTGTGISSPDRIFEPFFTTKPAGKGTGLGLSVSYGIVREHGGEIQARNWERGALFTVRLPRADDDALKVEAEPDDGEQLPRRAGRVLVVDDEEVLLSVQESMLHEVGLEVDCADGADAAMALMRERSYDLVICDIRMPGRDGLDLFVWVSENVPELQDRFLLTSGDLVSLAQKEGQLPVPCLRKPFELEAYVRTVLDAVNSGVRAS